MLSMGESELARSPSGEGNNSNATPQIGPGHSSHSSPRTEGSAGQMADTDLDWFFPDGADMDDFDESGASARANRARGGLGDDDVRSIIESENMRERERLTARGRQSISETDMRQARRLLTNKRERWRQQLVNEASTNLRQLIPTFPPDKKLSKHDVLRYSARYIVYMQHQLYDLLEQQQLQSGEHPGAAKKKALAKREHQDWQFASMYNHLPLNSVNAATMMTATTAYGRAASTLLRETRSTFNRTYATPSSAESPVAAAAAPVSSASQQQPQPQQQQQQQHPQQQRSSHSSPSGIAGGFPGPQAITTIPTPVLLSAGGPIPGVALPMKNTQRSCSETHQRHSGAGAVEAQGFPLTTMASNQWLPSKPPVLSMGGGANVNRDLSTMQPSQQPPQAHRGGYSGAALYGQAMAPSTLHWS